MSRAEDGRRSRNHIRQIRHYYLSGSSEPKLPPRPARRPETARIRVGGSGSSPWRLPFALNLALAAADGGEGARLTLPPHLIAAACRLLGASGAQLGPALAPPELRRAPPLHPGLRIDASTMRADHGIEKEYGWHFELGPGSGGGATWLYLLDAMAAAEFVDPRTGGEGPLFLIGLGEVPRPHRAAAGVWGALSPGHLLRPDGLPRAAYLGAPGALRARYRGFLEALRRIVGSRMVLAAGGGG